ncbi:MAG: ribonuclease Z [Candidatus Delongbacteria bacterium]|nr:ribonuclease Z [Candidatus Delongbacteria bacterium]MBN2836655.1 ribonuclease Z [Candidatus Delongbacteria bacterium]
MEVIVLGSSGGAPSRYRNCTSLILNTDSYGIMFDCAEGTQRQLLKASYKLSRIHYIFISHMHQDHIGGLVPMLSTKSMFNIPGKVVIIGPAKIKEYLEFNFNITQSRLGFEVEFFEAENNSLFTFKDFSVTTYLLNHRMSSYGFRVVFNDKPGNIDLEKAASFGLTPSPLLGQLQKVGSIELDGRIVTMDDIASPPTKGKTFTYIGDTYLCDNIYEASQDADMLYIESTFQKENDDRAADRMHLTSYMCGEIAYKANVKSLVLSHFSASYNRFEKFREDAQELFKGKIYLAFDLDSYPVQ